MWKELEMKNGRENQCLESGGDKETRKTENTTGVKSDLERMGGGGG